MTPQEISFPVAQERETPSLKCETEARGASVWTELHGQITKESWQ